MQPISQLILDENNVAFCSKMGNSYKLNSIAKEIISLIMEKKTKKEIVDELSSKYEVEPHELFIDVSDFFLKLKVYGLLA